MPLTFFGYNLIPSLATLVLAFTVLGALIVLAHLWRYRVSRVVAPDEKVVKVVRKHWFIILLLGVRTFLLLLLPFLLYEIIFSEYILSLVSAGFSGLNPATLHTNVSLLVSHYKTAIAVFYAIWAVFLLGMFFIEWVLYYLDMWVVTDKRILCIDQKWFFHREVITFNYEQIQDITVEMRGFLQTVLHYGVITIETAGEKSNISIRNAAEPEQAHSVILEQQEKSFAKTT